MALFQSAMDILIEMGFFNVILPFLLVYAIVYGILVRTKVFGPEQTSVNAIISFAIALFFVAAANVVQIIQEFLPWVGVIAIFIVGVMMLGVLIYGGEMESFSKQFKVPGILITIVALFYALFYAAGWWTGFVKVIQYIFTSKDILGIVLLIIIILVIYFITKSGKGAKKEEKK